MATWGTREEFDRQRAEAGQWVFWEDRAELVLDGRYTEVTPLHVEVSPTYLCNFACPWCSCRSAREEWSEDDVFNHPRATPLTVMRQSRLESVVDHLTEHGIEIMWVGGEPTMNPLLYPAVQRAHQHGLNQCIFTNGSLFKQEQAETLFDSELVFIRVSLNAVTPEVHQKHHDYDPRRRYAERVLRNLETLARLRAQQRSATMLGVSVVVDGNNINDIEPTVRLLADLCERNGGTGVDYLLLRPAFPLVGAHVDIDERTRDSFVAQIAPGSPVRWLTGHAGIDLVVPDASVEPSRPLPPDDLGCLAAGWFGEVTPSGDMLPCSDLYGDPEYFIGNVAADPVSRVWAGHQRAQVLSTVAERQCASTRCPTNGRGQDPPAASRPGGHHQRLVMPACVNCLTGWIDISDLTPYQVSEAVLARLTVHMASR